MDKSEEKSYKENHVGQKSNYKYRKRRNYEKENDGNKKQKKDNDERKNSNIKYKKNRKKKSRELKVLDKYSENLEISELLLLDDETKLEFIIEILKKIKPDYKKEYERSERKKPEKYRLHLREDFDLSDVAYSAKGDTIEDKITQKALIMFYANKLGHACNFLAKKMLNQFCKQNDIKYNGRQNPIFDEVLFGKLTKALSIYFNSDPEIAVSEIKESKKTLERFGIEEKDLKELEKRGYGKLVNTYRNMMFIKENSIKELIPMVKRNRKYSFGLSKEVIYNQFGTRKEREAFVIDIPFYSQIGVHIKSQELITALSGIEYAYPLYETENVLILDETSPEQEKYISEHKKDLTSSLIRMKDKRFAHTIAVKSGMDKKTLDKIHDER